MITILVNSSPPITPGWRWWFCIFSLIPVAIVAARTIVSLIDRRHYKKALAGLSAEDRERVIRGPARKRPSRWFILSVLLLLAASIIPLAYVWVRVMRREWPGWTLDALFGATFLAFLAKGVLDQFAQLIRVEASPLPSVYVYEKKRATVVAIALDSALICCLLVCWILDLQYSWSMYGIGMAMPWWMLLSSGDQWFYPPFSIGANLRVTSPSR